VEQADLDFVLALWGRDASTPPAGWINDLPSGIIDQQELDAVLANWGRSLPVAVQPAEPQPLRSGGGSSAPRDEAATRIRKQACRESAAAIDRALTELSRVRRTEFNSALAHARMGSKWKV
jgi:hypothetical protein